MPYLRKQQTQLTSKMRFVAAQFGALLQDDLWRANAAHANAMARRLADGAADVDGVEIVHPVQANAVFARLGPRHIAALRRDWFFHVWDERESVVRWMAAFDTTEADVDAFLAAYGPPQPSSGPVPAGACLPSRIIANVSRETSLYAPGKRSVPTVRLVSGLLARCRRAHLLDDPLQVIDRGELHHNLALVPGPFRP